MSEQTNLPQDALLIDDAVIEKITGIAAREVNGVLAMKGSLMSGFASSFSGGANATKGVTATVEGSHASIELKVILEYGASAPEVFEKVKVTVREQVRHMTGLHVNDIQLRVVDVMTRAEYDRNRKEVSDKQAPQA